MSASSDPKRDWGHCTHTSDPCTTLSVAIRQIDVQDNRIKAGIGRLEALCGFAQCGRLMRLECVMRGDVLHESAAQRIIIVDDQNRPRSQHCSYLW